MNAQTGAAVAVIPEVVIHATGKQGKKELKALSELPAKCWTLAEQDKSGIQYYTTARMGLSTHSVMLDGGSGVNSTTEEIILQLQRERGGWDFTIR